MHILVVDDDPGILEFVCLALMDEGHTVATAHEGARALAAAEARPPDLVLLDLRMPGMDGWDFIEEYRRRAANPAPIVVLTAARDDDPRVDRTPAARIVAKPFDLDELLEIVSSFAARAGGSV